MLPIFLIFSKFIFPIFSVFLIFSNYIFLIFPILTIFLLFSNFIFVKVSIFLIISHFLFLKFHTFNFSNSHSYSIPPLVPYFIPPCVTLLPNCTSFSSHFIIFPNFINRTSTVSLQLYSLHFTFQPYTFFPRSSFFNHFPALDILSLQCPVHGLVPSLSYSSNSI